MLRKIRVVLAVFFLIGITLMFVDFTGLAHRWLGWMTRVQLLPALLSLNFVVVAVLLLATFIFGRVYCSVICPLGVMQDAVSLVSSRRKGKKYRFRYTPAVKWLRLPVLLIFIAAMVLGIGSIVSLLAPYSTFGRIVQNLLSPIWVAGNNLLAYFAERADSYAFYQKDLWIRSLIVFGITAAQFVIIAILAWRNGRIYCNTICPIGTFLGFFSYDSLLKPIINTEKCNNCGLCERQCKASCIDSRNHRIDYSRCVSCMDCIDNCRHDAITYSLRTGRGNRSGNRSVNGRVNGSDNPKKGTPDGSRRRFLSGTAVLATTAAVTAKDKKFDGGLAAILDKQVPERSTKILPPGAISINHLARHCTGCQLCVSACPNGVLRPSTSLEALMQPESSYERGYCRPECTKCSSVCPTGAITKITRAEKSSIQIGHAVWVKNNCVVITDDVDCGNCARHCPAGAITMIALEPGNPSSRKIPCVDTERCIGCGACENLCPSRPFSAIFVDGHEVHKMI